jgi:predicted metal-dependent phosphoesterase TrpH
MNSRNFERGSEWRKWDLHLHSPASYDYKNKSIECKQIIETLKEHEVSAAVITDHNIIDVDNIKKLMEMGESEGILILPGIEFRSEIGGQDSVHFIGILDNKDIESNWTKISGKLDLTEKDIKEKGHKAIYMNLEDVCKKIHELGGITTVHAGTKTNSIENITNKQFYKQVQKKNY